MRTYIGRSVATIGLAAAMVASLAGPAGGVPQGRTVGASGDHSRGQPRDGCDGCRGNGDPSDTDGIDPRHVGGD
ncbi:hypothetical protein ACIQU6_38200, partial [Streptomyces sp. NPDC090442]|uniref:hypothetical protein n=1 Tax=Streptomyces sp. NPDC090442 TaxID=3365962 RepID=UPI00380F6964